MGFPIRTSSDHGSFANSPRLIAGYNVLLRLLVPRHPPCALKNLTTAKIADTKDKSLMLQRCSRPLCSSQATNDPTPTRRRAYHQSYDQQRFTRQGQSVKETSPPGAVAGTRRPVPSGPNSVLELPQATGTRRSHPTRRRTSRCTSTRARKKSMFHP